MFFVVAVVPKIMKRTETKSGTLGLSKLHTVSAFY